MTLVVRRNIGCPSTVDELFPAALRLARWRRVDRWAHIRRRIYSSQQVPVWLMRCWRVMQIIIIQFGSMAFSTASLDIDHWIWCILFGAGELLWGQVSLSISVFLIARLGTIDAPRCERSLRVVWTVGHNPPPGHNPPDLTPVQNTYRTTLPPG